MAIYDSKFDLVSMSILMILKIKSIEYYGDRDGENLEGVFESEKC